jgi:hypothetical protein
MAPIEPEHLHGQIKALSGSSSLKQIRHEARSARWVASPRFTSLELWFNNRFRVKVGLIAAPVPPSLPTFINEICD